MASCCCERERVKKRTEHIQDWPIHGWLDLWKSETWCLRIFYIILIAFAFCIAVYMCDKIVKDGQAAPTSSKVEYAPISTSNNVQYPVLTICDNTGTYFLNRAKLIRDRVSDAAVKAALLIGPVWTLSLKEIPDKNVFQDRSAQEFLARLERLYGADPVAQLTGFFADYGVSCADLFHSCRSSTWRQLDCCELLKPVAHMRHGLCYASNVAKWPEVKAPGLFSNIFIQFNRPDVWIPPEVQRFRRPSLEVTLDSVDQGVWRSDPLILHFGDWTTLKLTATKIIVEEGSAPCAGEADQELEYFMDYTFSNCMYERRLLKNPAFKTPENCRLPITFLTKRGLGFVNGTGAGEKAEKANEGKASEGAKEKKPEEKRRFCTKEESHRSVYPFMEATSGDLNPYELLRNETTSFGGITYWMEKAAMEAVNPCLEACVQWNYDFTEMTEYEFPDNKSAGITMTFSDPQFMTIKEIVTLQWTDYLALVGGIWGLWMGASILTVVQLVVYIFRSICRMQHVTVKPKKKEPSDEVEKVQNGETKNGSTNMSNFPNRIID